MLENPCLVPDMRKHLISLGMLDSRVSRFSSGGKVLWVLKGNRDVVHGKMIGNLYGLVGSVVIGGSAVKHGTCGKCRNRWIYCQTWGSSTGGNLCSGSAWLNRMSNSCGDAHKTSARLRGSFMVVQVLRCAVWIHSQTHSEDFFIVWIYSDIYLFFSLYECIEVFIQLCDM